MKTSTVGLDAMALSVPQGYVEMSTLAAARGVPASKFIEGLGVTRMAVAAAHEDPVALAANAGARALQQSGRSVEDIGLCIVGTESGVDHSKPVASYLQSLLDLPHTARVFDTQHACYGATAGLLNALDWIASGSHRGKAALIIATDVARYPVGSAGEPTQGAGAVAMVVAENPRLLAMDVGKTGAFTQDVHDFWRPLHSKDAMVDGHYSVQCYLDALAGAYQAWLPLHPQRPHLARTCYHVPYGKMARKAHRHRKMLDGLTVEQADATFTAQVASSLVLPALVGNIYTGSLYLALASMLYLEAAVLEGEKLGLLSYGSGCQAEFMSGNVVAGAAAWVKTLDLVGQLETRTALTVEQYEEIRRQDAMVDRCPVGSLVAPANGLVAYLGVEGEKRIYRRAQG